MNLDKQEYHQVPGDDSSQSATESDNLLHEGLSISIRRREHAWWVRVLIILSIVFLLGIYTVLVVTVTNMSAKKERLHGANVIYSPLREYIEYEPFNFETDPHSPAAGLMEHPSDELDAKWSSLMKYFFSEVPYQYMERLGRLDEGLQLPNGNYAANYAFMHQLHCLKRIHHSYYPERYFPGLTEHEKYLQQEHNLHCLEMIVEAIMCKADETPLTLRWLENSMLPTGNRTIAHECVKWPRLLEGMERYRVDPFVKGVFVHPKFGAVLPDGKESSAIVEERIGFTPNATQLDTERIGHHHHDIHEGSTP